MTHTPGQWSMRERYIRILDSTVTMDVFAITAHSGDDTICEIPMGDNSVAESNARLIAAAPELFEACRDALHQISTDSDLETVTGADKYKTIETGLRAAIAKAEGRE